MSIEAAADGYRHRRLKFPAQRGNFCPNQTNGANFFTASKETRCFISK
jgi:hypothetical protein